MKIGFVGLGAMGRGMAASLIRAGHQVVGYDLSTAALNWLEDQGGTPVSSAASAAQGAEAFVLMVVNAAQAEEVLFAGGVVEALGDGALVLSSVTMPTEAAERIGAEVTKAGLLYLDAPVSGGVVAAEGGTLTFMGAGADAAWEAGLPLMQDMGEHIYRFGDVPGPGSTMKMVHQLAAGCNLAVAAEVMSFGAHLGLDPEKVLELLNVSAGGSWMIANRGPRMLTEGLEPKSAVDIFVKDLGIVLDAARTNRFPVPVSAAALQVFLGASAAGFGGHDDSQGTRFYESLGGKKVRKT